MVKKKKQNKPKYNGEELERILKRLEEQGLVNSDESYFQDLKDSILKRKKKEITLLKNELESLANQRFTSKAEYLDYLKTLFPDVPLPPLKF